MSKIELIQDFKEWFNKRYPDEQIEDTTKNVGGRYENVDCVGIKVSIDDFNIRDHVDTNFSKNYKMRTTSTLDDVDYDVLITEKIS